MRRRVAAFGAAAVVVVGGGTAWAITRDSAPPRAVPRVTVRVAVGPARPPRTPARPPRPRPRATAKVRLPARRVNVLALAGNSSSRCGKAPPPLHEHVITRATWLSGVVITEYYPAPERWFGGARVAAPGLPGRHAVDWLYSARGLAMEGDGVDASGRPARIAQLGSTGWVDFAGHMTLPVCLGKWSAGFPVWLKGGWRNARGQVTYPLASGGWANGVGVRALDYGGVTFAAGESQPLRYYHSIAVDPGLIPEGSRVFIPAYRHVNGGWFVAQDTGGAIRGRHIDVYRPAPASPDDLGLYLTGQRVLVIPPG